MICTKTFKKREANKTVVYSRILRGLRGQPFPPNRHLHMRRDIYQLQNRGKSIKKKREDIKVRRDYYIGLRDQNSSDLSVEMLFIHLFIYSFSF